MNAVDTMNTIDTKVLLEQLSAQYRLHTEQARNFLGYGTGSLSVLILLLTGTFTLSKDYPTLLFLAPFSMISYTALVGLIFLYVNLNTLYSELIERKINFLLSDLPLYQYETKYVAYNDNKGEVGLHYVLVILAGLTPLASTIYSVIRLGQNNSISIWIQILIFLAVALSYFLVFHVLMSIRKSRRIKNQKLYTEWEDKIRAIQMKLPDYLKEQQISAK